MPSPRLFAALTINQALTELALTRAGLNEQEAAQRQKTFGENKLPHVPEPGTLRRFLRQFKSPLIGILCAAAVLMPFVGTIKDSMVILFVLLFNATVGTMQEGRASRALRALETITIPRTRVRRNGTEMDIPTRAIVPGDIVLLREGDIVPADGRLIQCTGLRIDESMLTGESAPVTKTVEPAPASETTPLGDLRNAAFRQTHVVTGSGELLATATGADTEVGKIAEAIQTHDTEPPLAKKIRFLSRAIALVVFLFSAALFLFGLAVGRPAPMLFATVLSLAVSIIPEGLPVVLTLVLARGVHRMARKQAVVKRLHAVEGLGQVQVICTDKTGTLTKNELVVRETSVTGTRNPATDMKIIDRAGSRQRRDKRLVEAAAAFGGSTADPVDAALAAFVKGAHARLHGLVKIDERPFSYEEKKRFAKFRAPDGRIISYMAGSPERVFAICEANGERATSEDALKRFASQGLRVIAFASREGNVTFDETTIPWKCVGCVALEDEIRPEAAESVTWCREQGIRVVMVTGDHPETALAIARRVGIASQISEVLNGDAFETISDESLAARLDNIRVFARISPQHKLRIVEAYRASGHVTAMTGDGVNDAPALHAADIGVAMGKSGTEVAREASDLVLLDDNFATIVTAVQEGRAIIGNVRKVVTYLFSTSIAEALVLTTTLLGGLPLPLLPAQIIWLNLVTDGFLDVSLAMESTHAHKRVTKRNNGILDRRAVSRMLLLGSVMAGGTFLVYLSALDRAEPALRSLTLLTLAIFQWMNAWSARSESASVFRLSPVSNPYLIAATGTIILLQLGGLYVPALQNILGTVPLALNDWLLAIGISTAVICADEIWKRAMRESSRDFQIQAHPGLAN